MSSLTDDVTHIIYIDLEGKLMCCKKSACFYDNKFIFWNYIWIYRYNNYYTTKNMLLVKVFLKFLLDQGPLSGATDYPILDFV